MLNQQEIDKAYSRVVWFYDVWSSLTESKAVKRVLELASIKDGESVLEVAVGTGIAFEQIVKANPHGRNEGLDLSRDMLSKAKTKLISYSNYDLGIGDAHKLPYDSDTFDVLINNYMFDLLPEEDFVGILQGFIRILKSNGRMVISTMTLGRKWHNRIWNFISVKAPSLLTGCRAVEMEAVIKNIGFKNIRSEYISQNTFPSKVIYAEKA